MAVRLLFVEDQPVVRLGLKALLAGSDVKLSELATTGDEAVKKAAATKVDLVLLDVRLPDGDGLTTLARIKANQPDLPVLMFSAYENPTFIARAVALGASGYVLKGVSKDELLIAIHRAAAGETHWTREELRRVTSALAAPRTTYDVDVPLTRREMEVLHHLVSGHTNKKIAEVLGISYETVKEHVQNLLKKVGVVDRTQAAVWAIRTGLVE